jgi:hypothetical protein
VRKDTLLARARSSARCNWWSPKVESKENNRSLRRMVKDVPRVGRRRKATAKKLSGV